MAKVIKLVDGIIPSVERTQTFTNADAVTGDILDLEASLGRPAKLIKIETSTGDLTVRTNVVQTIYPQRNENLFDGALHGQAINVADGREIVDGSKAAMDANPTLELNGPVKNLEVNWSTGTWEITAF